MDISERDDATTQVLSLLDEWGNQSKFIWFREIHRLTYIDKGLLRNVIKDLKKSREIIETKNDNNRIFYCLKKHYTKCRDLEYRFKGKSITLNDGSKAKVIQGSTKSSERTRKRLEKQKQKRNAKLKAKLENKKIHR